jgi:hypothetical protein
MNSRPVVDRRIQGGTNGHGENNYSLPVRLHDPRGIGNGKVEI